MSITPHLFFLGTSGSKGVPQLGCFCPVCRAAKRGTRNFRTRASLLLVGPEGRILIDTPHETRLRFTELGWSLPNALLMTHPHDDHILGFADFVKAVRDLRQTCPIFAPNEVFTGLRERFAYLWRGKSYSTVMDLRTLEGPITLLGWRVQAIRVHHGFNGWSYGYLIEREGWRVGYFSDAIHVGAAVEACWHQLDLLILGSNFWRETAPIATRSVYDVGEAVEVAKKAAVKSLILTHLSHDIDEAEGNERLPEWASFAWDGRVVMSPTRKLIA